MFSLLEFKTRHFIINYSQENGQSVVKKIGAWIVLFLIFQKSDMLPSHPGKLFTSLFQVTKGSVVTGADSDIGPSAPDPSERDDRIPLLQPILPLEQKPLLYPGSFL